MPLGLSNIRLGLSQRGGASAAFSVALTGLTDGEARIGDHASIGYTTDPVSATETVKWSNSSDDGAERVTNGGFDADSAWTKGVGWTISGGNLNFSGATAGAGTYTDVDQVIPAVAGTTYDLSFDVNTLTNVGVNEIRFIVTTYPSSTTQVDQFITTTGAKSFSFTVPSGDSTAGIFFAATVNTDGDEIAVIDNVSVTAQATYGTGASPTDFTAGDEGSLWLHVTDTIDGVTDTVSRNAPIRYAPGAFAALADQTFTNDSGNQTYVFAAATGTGLTWTYSLVSPPAGVTINSGTRTITFDTDALALQSGTVITVAAVDQYGRPATGSPRTFALDIAVV